MREKISILVGARPNYIKVALVQLKLRPYFDVSIIHTGQHYGSGMVESNIVPFVLPVTHQINSSTSNIQDLLSEILVVLKQIDPKIVMVVGDVNSTLAGAMAAKVLGKKLCHIEAGLRCGDPFMPEERNRILTDTLSDILFCTQRAAVAQLMLEFGGSGKHVLYSGQTLLDPLVDLIEHGYVTKYRLLEDYGVVTLHRDNLLNNCEKLESTCYNIRHIATKQKVNLVLHPHLLNKLKEYDLLRVLSSADNINLMDPMPYLDFVRMVSKSCWVITDSGGLQQESALLNIPTVVYRETTEHTILNELSDRLLVSNNIDSIELFLLNWAKIIGTTVGTNEEMLKEAYCDGLSSTSVAKQLINYCESGVI